MGSGMVSDPSFPSDWSIVMQFRNEERTHKLLCWWMDLSLIVMVGWIIGLVADMIRLS